MREEIELRHSHRLISHGAATLVTAKSQGVRNVMTATWITPIAIDPPKIIAVFSASLTRDLIMDSGEFVINIPQKSMARKVLSIGSSTGRLSDKFADNNLITSPASEVDAPLIDGCIGWLECRLNEYFSPRGRHDIFGADVVRSWADSNVFHQGQYTARLEEVGTVHHASGANFYSLSRIDMIGEENA